MTSSELRDHAQQILEAVAADLRTSQSSEEQANKSMGLAVVSHGAPETAAQTHAVLRAKSGYNVNQVVSEYRALRASVLSRWVEACQPSSPFLQDVIRFNEAIDQAVAESVSHYSAWMEQSRNLLLGSLSHDMRNPLQTVKMTAVVLGRLNAGNEVSAAAKRLINSGTQLQSLLDDLVDFNRTNLGLGISIIPSQVDLGELCDQEVEQLRVVYPDSQLQLRVNGDCHGYYDAKRMRQVIGNLVTNAIQYGASNVPIRVAVIGGETRVSLEVSNGGSPIEREVLTHLFEPLKRATTNAGHPGLGLGLYIVREIAKGHGGIAEARSNERETVFSVQLPRRTLNSFL